VLNIQKGVVYVKQEKPQKNVRKNARIENSFPCPVQTGKLPYLCASAIFKGILSLIAPSGHALTQQLQYQQASGYVMTGKPPLGLSK